MTSDAAAQSRGAGDALDEIRHAEAERMLGLPISVDLSSAAKQWVADGIATDDARALAGAGADVSDGVRSALLHQLAREVGATFSSTHEARTLLANGLIRTMHEGGDVAEGLYGLSNGLTDELSANVRRFFARLLGRDHRDT